MPDDFGSIARIVRPRIGRDRPWPGLLHATEDAAAKLFYDEEGCRLFR